MIERVNIELFYNSLDNTFKAGQKARTVFLAAARQRGTFSSPNIWDLCFK